MKKTHLKKLIIETSEAQAWLLYIVLLALRFKRAIPHLRARQIIIPATLVQALVFIFAAHRPEILLIVSALVSFIVAAVVLYPTTYPPEPVAVEIHAHWVRPHYD